MIAVVGSFMIICIWLSSVVLLSLVNSMLVLNWFCRLWMCVWLMVIVVWICRWCLLIVLIMFCYVAVRLNLIGWIVGSSVSLIDCTWFIWNVWWLVLVLVSRY